MGPDSDRTEEEILRLLDELGSLGFSEIVELLKARIPTSSPKISRRLRSLVDQGIVERTVTRDWPPRTLYTFPGSGSRPVGAGPDKTEPIEEKAPKADKPSRMPAGLRSSPMPALLCLFLAVCVLTASLAILEDTKQINSLKKKIRINEERIEATEERLSTASRLLESITDKLDNTSLALEDRTSELVRIRSELATLESRDTQAEAFSLPRRTTGDLKAGEFVNLSDPSTTTLYHRTLPRVTTVIWK